MKKVMVRALFGVFFGISWAVYASDSPEFIQKLLELNAPVVYFHPQEPYFPLAVEHFFKNSALYDNNGNIVIHRGDLTVPLLAQYHGPEYTEYRLSPNPQIYSGNTPVQGVVQAPVYAHWVRTSENTGVVQYWFNSGYNGPLTVPGLGALMRVLGIGAHEADKEHVTVHVERKPGSRRDDPTSFQVREVFFSRHEACKHGGYVPYKMCETNSDGCIVVYAARNNHASYPHPYPIDALCDEMSAHGPVWHTGDTVVNTGVLAHPSPGSEWLNFPGAWGKNPAPHTETFQEKWRECPKQTCMIAAIAVNASGVQNNTFSLRDHVPTRIRTVRFNMPLGVMCTIAHQGVCGVQPVYERIQNGSVFSVEHTEKNLIVTQVTGTHEPFILYISGIEAK